MKKVLIVDDREEVRELVKATLETEEYEILEADSGEKSIEVARMEKPELILMDSCDVDHLSSQGVRVRRDRDDCFPFRMMSRWHRGRGRG